MLLVIILSWCSGDGCYGFCFLSKITVLQPRGWSAEHHYDYQQKKQQENHHRQQRNYFTTIALFSTPTANGSGNNGSNDSASEDRTTFKEPSIEESPRFGRKDYWNDFYSSSSSSLSRVHSGNSDRKNDKNNDRDNDHDHGFSWYATWEDLEPFIKELLPTPSSKILVPGVGNDSTLIDMVRMGGYTDLVAFDYASEGILRMKEMVQQEQQSQQKQEEDDINNKIHLCVADARHLEDKSVFQDNVFDGIFDKGTLDAIYLSGGSKSDGKQLGKEYVKMSLSEFYRVLKPNGILISISAACVDAIKDAVGSATTSAKNHNHNHNWIQIRDTSQQLYMTEDGYTSNNIDATLLAWRKEE